MSDPVRTGDVDGERNSTQDRSAGGIDDASSNNNSGHIVVDNSENNNVDGAAVYNKEDDAESQAQEGVVLSEGEDEDENYADDETNPQSKVQISAQGTANLPQQDQDDVWLSEDEDEDENYTDDEPDMDLKQNPMSMMRAPIPQSELPDTVTVLEHGNNKLYLVGTAHFSKESQNDVSKVIQLAKPHVILVELCQSRVNILKMDEARILEEAKNINMNTIMQLIQRNGVMQGVLNILLLNMSAYITKELGMAPGGEFRTAFKEARKLEGGCKFILGDRPIQITLQRALASLSLWQRLKLAYAILCSKEPITKEDVEKCKQKDILEQTIEQMTGEFPALGKVFVNERDVYLAHSLRRATQPIPCSDVPEGEVPVVVVGVVGIGHVKGITENWGHDLDVEEICRIPKPSLGSVIARWGFKLSTFGLLGYGCYKVSRLTVVPWISSIIK